MESGLLKAGRVLVLVGAILSVVAGVILLVTGVGLGVIVGVAGSGEDAFVGPILGAVYGIIGAVTIAGAVFGFAAYGRVGRGDVHGGWVFGLVSALLPPVQTLTLIGAILILVSPEHEQWKEHA